MLICGVKVSHDGGIAIIDGNRLICSIEVEKLGNAPRYSSLEELDCVTEILEAEGIAVTDVDQFVVDGWWAEGTDEYASVATAASGKRTILPVAPYVEHASQLDPLHRYTFSDHDFSSRCRGYSSYHHASNHLIGAYCASPFARRAEDALVLVWDGGMTPHLYEVSARHRTAKVVSLLLPLTGNVFADFCAHFEPFLMESEGMDPDEHLKRYLAIAGKAMAYAGLGTVDESAFVLFDDIIARRRAKPSEVGDILGAELAANRDLMFPVAGNADLIATFQAYVGRLLLNRLTAVAARRFPGPKRNLVLSGGCALNIKWSSAIRASGIFAETWIPPFPNDSGAAIGTACCEMFRTSSDPALDWDVYRGPRLATSAADLAGWISWECDEQELAWILHTEEEPVVVLSGRAELGPRALGNRSILAPARGREMKGRLNEMKDRADYRPVAPVCLESRVNGVFVPGGPDRYMVFEHTVRPEWAERIPAIVHVDGTARLQVISPAADSPTARILTEYERLTGIPVLCNTSANYSGRGFFPDVASAAAWGRARYIWSDGRLYVNKKPAVTGSRTSRNAGS
jgi:carbamoyltransferase